MVVHAESFSIEDELNYSRPDGRGEKTRGVDVEKVLAITAVDCGKAVAFFGELVFVDEDPFFEALPLEIEAFKDEVGSVVDFV